MSVVFKRAPQFVLLAIILSAALLPRAYSFAQGTAMLAVIDNDGNISVFDSTGKNPFLLTHDARHDERQYRWPTWATDGRLAFFGSSVEPADSFLLRMFVVGPVKTNAPIETAFTSNSDIFTYAYWGPGDCAKGNCRDLALLSTPTDQSSALALRLIRDDNGKFTDKLIGNAAPYYYSFSPDAKQLFWYRSTSELGIYDIASDKVIATLNDRPGAFNAPMWSPIDDRLLFGTAGTADGQTNIVIGQGANRQTLVSDQPNPVSFAWSPDASMVVSVAAFGNLVVTDVKSGKAVANTTDRNVVSYFWSPQSDRVAYVAASRPGTGSQASFGKNGAAPTA
jgi:WD40 repeat protein